jgi:hypothetical protein
LDYQTANHEWILQNHLVSDPGSDHQMTNGLEERYIQCQLSEVNSLFPRLEGAVAIGLAVLYLRAPTFDVPRSTLVVGLGGSLLVLLGVLFGQKALQGNEITPLQPTNPMVYPVVVATGVVIVEFVNRYTKSKGKYIVVVVGFFLLIAPILGPQELPNHTIFLDYALVGYWGGPAMEWLGQYFNLKTYVEPID